MTTAATGAGAADDSVELRHYGFLAFLTVLNVMNFVDRQLLQSFANFIVPELGLTDTQFGLLTGFAFILFYAFMGLFMGAAADMFHRPRLVAVGLTLWSLLTAISGMAKGFTSLALPRMFIGVGESVLTPTSMSMLADRFPASKLGFAAGTYYMGVPIGVGASLMIAGYLGPAIGWRNCFYILGAIGICLAIVMLFVKETPRRHDALPQDSHAEEPAPVERPKLKVIFATAFHALANCPALALTMAGGVALHFILGAAAFDQLWFVQERGFDRAFIAQATGWIAVIAGVLGNLFGGMGSDWYYRKTGNGRAMFLFWIMLILAPVNIAYRLVPPDTIWFWLGVFVGFFQLGCFYGPTFASVQELVPPQIRATVVAFYILVLNLVGLGFGITAGGICIDWMKTEGIGEPYTWTLVVFTAISLLAIPLFLLAGRRFERDRDHLAALTARSAGA